MLEGESPPSLSRPTIGTNRNTDFLTKQGVRRCSLIEEVERQRKHVQKK